MDLAKMRRLLALRAEIDQAKEALKKLGQQEAELEEQVSAMLVNAGVPSLTIDGRTVYLTTTYQVNKRGGVDAASAVETLRSLGLEDLVETAPQPARVKAWAVEQIKKAREENPTAEPSAILPTDFTATFGVFERQAVADRKK